jgi:Golgi phosphoprotein 3 (GPP34)
MDGAYLTSPRGSQYAEVVLIAEELLLVAIDPVKGTVPLGARTYLNVGLAGALLAELAIAREPRHQGRADRARRRSSH